MITDDHSAWHYRGPLIRALVAKGLDVYVLTPEGEYVDRLKSLGAKHIPIRIHRFMDPIGDLRFIFELYHIFRKERFDLVHNFSIKPNTFGAIVAKLAGLKKIVGSVTGLGYVFTLDNSVTSKILRFIVWKLYWLGFTCSEKVWLQNPDDIELLVSLGILTRSKAVLIKSSGVDLDLFAPSKIDVARLNALKQELSVNGTKKIVTMIARPLWTKGVKEFVEALHIVQQRMPDVCFLLVGQKEIGNPDNVSDEFLQASESDSFHYLGWRSDIREIMALSSVIVLPSYYREGIPKSLVESLAMGKAIVTTENIGCKETVEHGKNGYLVPIKDSLALADAIETILADPQKLQEFGMYARKKAEQEFDEKIVISRIIQELYSLE